MSRTRAGRRSLRRLPTRRTTGDPAAALTNRPARVESIDPSCRFCSFDSGRPAGDWLEPLTPGELRVGPEGSNVSRSSNRDQIQAHQGDAHPPFDDDALVQNAVQNVDKRRSEERRV